MRRRSLLGLILAGVIILIGAGAFALTYSPPRPTLTPQPSLTPTQPVTQVARTFSIDQQISKINYIVTLSTGTRIPGTLGVSGRTVELVPEENGFRMKINALINGASIKSVDNFIATTLAQYLEVDKYPTAGFTADSTTTITGEDGTFKVDASGILELHGVKRNVTVPLQITLKDGRISAVGTVILDVLDYDVRVPTMIVKSVLDFEIAVVGFDDAMPKPTETEGAASTTATLQTQIAQTAVPTTEPTPAS